MLTYSIEGLRSPAKDFWGRWAAARPYPEPGSGQVVCSPPLWGAVGHSQPP